MRHADDGEFFALPCDIFVPAALGHVIDEKVAKGLQCKVAIDALIHQNIQT